MTDWTEVSGVRLIHGDCLDVMPTLDAGSIDLILSDLPYGTTACKWDTVIPFGPLWECFRHVLKPRGAVVLTACQPFTSMLVMSNLKWFRHELVWDKVKVTGFLSARKYPMRRHRARPRLLRDRVPSSPRGGGRHAVVQVRLNPEAKC